MHDFSQAAGQFETISCATATISSNRF